MQTRTRFITLPLLLLLGLAACGDDATGPEIEPGDSPAAPGSYNRSQLVPEGEVTETEDGFIVNGTLHLETERGRTSFRDANLDVRFDEDGRLTSVSGRAQIPSPHERIEFADPVQADVGFFSGSFLNENRDFDIRLRDDTDYFIFHFAVTLEMRVATGETGEDATKPIVVRAPVGGKALMVVDYTDPMYYVYGAQDLIGSAGIGWSLNSRIPFEPWHPVEGLGRFDGRNTRTGSFSVLKVLSVSGQMVDNEYAEVHLTREDPLGAELRHGYQAGYNGAMGLDLFLKDIAGIEIPIGEGSGGYWREVSTGGDFAGEAYVNGLTTDDYSWWPTFIPATPVTQLQTSGFIKDNGDFAIDLAGEFGWDLPDGRHSMSGFFGLSPNAMTLGGAITSADITFDVTGRVTADVTTVSTAPPPELLDLIDTGVSAEIDERFAEAQKAWEDLQQATQDYEFELSLRGLRSSIPPMVDYARQALADGIASELSKHKDQFYYDDLRNRLNSAASPYYRELDRLKAAAQEIRDNDQTREEIEAALRSVAARKIFSTSFTVKRFGVTWKTIHISRRILSDGNANKLIEAADNVKYIKETWDRKVRLQQIYDAIPAREVFEQLKQDIESGTRSIPELGELGFELSHGEARTLRSYAIIADERRDLGALDIFQVPGLVDALAGLMVDVLVGT
ncbi:MAG: hypothetical protein ACN0LA_06420 [Candidatus Longimicrobiales bacterium M2_2A_002]